MSSTLRPNVEVLSALERQHGVTSLDGDDLSMLRNSDWVRFSRPTVKVAPRQRRAAKQVARTDTLVDEQGRMAKVNLLNTETPNLLDLLGNGRIYRVPPFQRDYSWREEQWEDLWADLLELRGDATRRHYMGAIVVEAKTDREFLIIDGQQRLTTLSLLVLAVLHHLHAMVERGLDAEENRQRIELLRGRFLGERDPASLSATSKLFLNRTDNDFYQTYLLQLREPLNSRALPASNRLMYECLCFFRARLKSVLDFEASGHATADFLAEVVARRLLFILITVEDELNAYTVFETLNARGVELSSTDLLKNHLFSRVHSEIDLNHLQRLWHDVLIRVGQDKFPEFLRFYLMLEHRQVRQQRLFKLVRDQVKTQQQVFQLLGELHKYAEIYAALGTATHEFWRDAPENRLSIRQLNLFRVRQMFPVLMAAYIHMPEIEFARLLRLMVVLSFRFTIVCGLNPNELEPLYHQVAKRVTEGLITTCNQAFAELRPVYVADDKFRRDFEVLAIPTKGQKKALARYVLCRLETDASQRNCDWETDPGTIEHVLPENPNEPWNDHFPGPIHAGYVYRLGNLSLLEAGANRQCGNLDYEQKLSIYQRSGYSLIQEIRAPEWTPEAVEQRQSHLARRACHVWRFDT